MWSTHALSAAGIAKLYIGAPRMISSALTSSEISSSESASAFLWLASCCSGVVYAPQIQSRSTNVGLVLAKISIDDVAARITFPASCNRYIIEPAVDGVATTRADADMN